MKNEKKEPRGFYVEKGSFFVHASVTILVIAVAFRLLGTLHLWNDMFQLATLVALPVVSALLFILFILLLGRVALWTTILPVLGGAAFFILSSIDEHPSWPMFICIALSFLASFVYTATLPGMIRTKWLNVIVFLGILVYQCAFIAYPAFSDQESPVSFADGMALLSSIGIVFAMFCASLAIRRRKPAKTEELPKIKDPKVVAPAQEEELQPVGENTSVPAAEENSPAEIAPASDLGVIAAPEEETIAAPETEEAPKEQ